MVYETALKPSVQKSAYLRQIKSVAIDSSTLSVKFGKYLFTARQVSVLCVRAEKNLALVNSLWLCKGKQ